MPHFRLLPENSVFSYSGVERKCRTSMAEMRIGQLRKQVRFLTRPLAVGVALSSQAAVGPQDCFTPTEAQQKTGCDYLDVFARAIRALMAQAMVRLEKDLLLGHSQGSRWKAGKEKQILLILDQI